MLINSSFKPPWWLRNRHLQTLWPYFFRRLPHIDTQQHRLELDDGDFLDINFSINDTLPANAPTVLVLHGLQGSIRSKYAAGMLRALNQNGYRGVLMHFRGCSDEMNRLARGYHSGETGDPLYVMHYLRKRFPNAPLAAIGFSLGGNALLKLQGELGAESPLTTAVAVSVPFLLNMGADQLNKGFSKIYQNHLVSSLINTISTKQAKLGLNNIDFQLLKRKKNFWCFDNEVTAKLHGFDDVHDYYKRSSSRQFLQHIDTPTLILHAADDPFLNTAAIPEKNELSPMVTLELSQHGGHVGFVSGHWPWKMRYWLEQRIIDHLNEIFKK